MNSIPFKLIVGYSNEINKRKYIINESIILNFYGFNNLLKYEHNDWFNFLIDKPNKISTIKDAKIY